jgi:hypothetical protein
MEMALNKTRMEKGLCQLCPKKHCEHEEIIKAVFMVGKWECEMEIKFCENHFAEFNSGVRRIFKIECEKIYAPFEHDDTSSTQYQTEDEEDEV